MLHHTPLQPSADAITFLRLELPKREKGVDLRRPETLNPSLNPKPPDEGCASWPTFDVRSPRRGVGLRVRKGFMALLRDYDKNSNSSNTRTSNDNNNNNQNTRSTATLIHVILEFGCLGPPSFDVFQSMAQLNECRWIGCMLFPHVYDVLKHQGGR